MSSPGPLRTPVFRAADLLRARDLADWRDAPIEALALHVRALHRLSGVADGLVVAFRRAHDAQWARWEFTATPGAAIDALGRTLASDAPPASPPALVTPTTDARLPASPEDAVLKLLVVIAGEPPGAAHRGGGRISPQHARLDLVGVGEEGELVYQTPCRPLHPWEVPLAGVRFYRVRDTNELAITLSGQERLVTLRSFRTTFTATGSVPSGATAQRLEEVGHDTTRAVGWQLWVDTRAAGFLPPSGPNDRQVPVYVATVGRPGNLSDQALLLSGRTSLDATPETVLARVAHDPDADTPR